MPKDLVPADQLNAMAEALAERSRAKLAQASEAMVPQPLVLEFELMLAQQIAALRLGAVALRLTKLRKLPSNELRYVGFYFASVDNWESCTVVRLRPEEPGEVLGGPKARAIGDPEWWSLRAMLEQGWEFVGPLPEPKP